MTCPACNGSKFEKLGNSVYCVNKINGKFCGVTLKGNLRREFFEKHASHKDRKKYFNEYYHRNKKRFKDGVLISDAAELKFVTVRCINKNKNKFDIVPGSHPVLIVFNNKFCNWKPKRER